jgi:hypothetical protein
MLHGTCHCGAIGVSIPASPEYVIDCNCSLCRRLGGLWAHYDASVVAVEAAPGALDEYVWGDRTLRTMRCATCGCVTHWESISEAAGTRCGVNLRNFDPGLVAGLRVRRFDGADTWAFLDADGGG